VTLTITGRTDRQTDGQTDRVRRNMRPPPMEEGRIKTFILKYKKRDKRDKGKKTFINVD